MRPQLGSVIGEGGVQLLADDTPNEVAKRCGEIRTGSILAVYDRTGAFSCRTCGAKLDRPPPHVPTRKDRRRLEKPSSLLDARGALSSRILLVGPLHELGGRGRETRRGERRVRAPPFAPPALWYVHRGLQLSRP
jgi:hypothetical protein